MLHRDLMNFAMLKSLSVNNLHSYVKGPKDDET